MTPTHDSFPESSPAPLFSSRSRRHRSLGPSPAVLVVPVVLLLAGGLGWFWMRSRAAPDADGGSPGTAVTRPADPTPSAGEPAAPPLELPPLSASDALVREMAGRLSAHPRLAAWLVNEELIRRFVVSVVRLAGGGSPASEVPFLRPEGDFQVREAGGRLFVHAQSYRRYDVFTQAFVSLDTGGAVLLYEQLHPLFDEAYRELGITDRSFDEHFERAVQNLLAVQVPATPPEVFADEAVYAFADPDLEELSEADKHLLRMGPENARRFQGKLSQIADGLGIERP